MRYEVQKCAGDHKQVSRELTCKNIVDNWWTAIQVQCTFQTSLRYWINCVLFVWKLLLRSQSSSRSSHLTSVSLTTLIMNHPIILPFQTQNFPISQILPSIDIWHLFGLISRIPGLFYIFLCFSFFSSFQLLLFPSDLVFSSKVSFLSHSRLFLGL